MRVKRVATVLNNQVVICRVLSEVKSTLTLLLLDQALNKVADAEPFTKRSSECVKVLLFKNASGALVNYEEEIQRATRALVDSSASQNQERATKRRKTSRDEISSGSSSDLYSSGSSPSSLEKRRLYSPSPKGQHDVVKNSHNLELCKQYNEMMRYYNTYEQSTSCALFLDSEQLSTQEALIQHCHFQEKSCLIPNPFEYEALKDKKSAGLYNMSLGSFLKKRPPVHKVITFAWFDYMNSLDGNLQDQKAGESSPREDIELYLKHWAVPFTLFAVTLCLRHSKYKTHDYNGGTEVVIMRYINDMAREAGFYFSILPPTGSYGSSMFIYAGVLLPWSE